jgi:DNA-directed RNA polymerase specialized sigma24 family protein
MNADQSARERRKVVRGAKAMPNPIPFEVPDPGQPMRLLVKTRAFLAAKWGRNLPEDIREDIAQDAVVEVLLEYADKSAREQEALARTIAHHKAYKRWKGMRGEETFSDEIRLPAAEDFDPTDRIAARERTEDLMEVFSNLSPGEQDHLELILEGCSSEEIRQKMGWATRAVENARKWELVQKIRRNLEMVRERKKRVANTRKRFWRFFARD